MADGISEMRDMVKKYALMTMCTKKGLDRDSLSKEKQEELIREWKAMCEEKRNEDRASEDYPTKAETIDDPAVLLAVPTLYKDAEITDFRTQNGCVLSGAEARESSSAGTESERRICHGHSRRTGSEVIRDALSLSSMLSIS